MALAIVHSRSGIREAYCKTDWEVDLAGDEAQQLQIYCYDHETLRAYGEQIGAVMAGAGSVDGS